MSRLLFQGVGGVEDISESLREGAKCSSFDSAESANADSASLRMTSDLGTEIDDPKLREECGVVAIHGHPDAARMAYLGLYALQHRGQESAGIATADGQHLANIKGMGLVSEIFTDDVLQKLPGDGNRPHALLDDGRLGPAECAADPSGFDQGADRDCA